MDVKDFERDEFSYSDDRTSSEKHSEQEQSNSHYGIHGLGRSNLDFVEDKTTSLVVPPSNTLKHNQAVTRSIAIDSFVQQNEDLQARLKVSFKKIHELEQNIYNKQQDMDLLRTEYSRLSDQLLIWQEKETFWKNKNGRLEHDLEMMNSRMPEYYQAEQKLERYRKYQEKIKTQVKPYIQQLKSFVEALQIQIKEQHRELNQKDMQFAQLERKQADLQKAFQEQISNFELSHRDMIESYEAERLSLQKEVESLKKENQAYFQKALKLDQTLERLDTTENKNVSLSRDNSEKTAVLENLKSENFALKNTLKDRDMQMEVMQSSLHSDQQKLTEKLAAAQAEKEELREQLYSLRLMWNVKSDENEKLKLANSSLEKLNHELSLQIAHIQKSK